MNVHSFYSFSKIDVGSVLSSQAVARQVLSPLQGFTTVFGMGTGGLPAIGHQQTCRLLISFYSRPQLYAEDCIRFSSILLILCVPSLIRLGNQRLLRRYRSVSSYKPLLSVNRVAHATLLYFGKCFPDCTPANAFRKSPRPISISRLKMLPLLHL